MKARIGFGLIVTMAYLNSGAVFADGQMQNQKQVPNQASDASFDKRLPPVLPGEEVRDGDKTIKMWSTSGPVPVSRAPQPFDDPRPAISPQVGVIVDERGRLERNDR